MAPSRHTAPQQLDTAGGVPLSGTDSRAGTPTNPERPPWRNRLEYVAVVGLFVLLRSLPRGMARPVGAALGGLLFWLHPRWRRVGLINLRLAFPELSERERRRILRRSFRHLGWHLAEFARFPRHTPESIRHVVVYDGFENYQRAAARGRGVLYLTAHVGAWELSSFMHSLQGYPLAYVNRPLDNPLVDALVNRYRCRGGNRALDRRHAARGILQQLRAGGAVGVLMDQNVLEGDANLFADFFGLPASTTAGLARLALRTDAAVVPVFLLWDGRLQRYRLRFEPALELVRTGDPERDMLENTACFNRVLEEVIRRHPDHWLWIHRRWATRPPGQPPLYPR
ncbi:MAG: lysophospholipid acyltransferase family protein [Acidobacteria bacterium]|nr:lysophospholipid acyltransferase family protein [Acidobacteriota bacterium]